MLVLAERWFLPRFCRCMMIIWPIVGRGESLRWLLRHLPDVASGQCACLTTIMFLTWVNSIAIRSQYLSWEPCRGRLHSKNGPQARTASSDLRTVTGQFDRQVGSISKYLSSYLGIFIDSCAFGYTAAVIASAR